MSEFKVNFAAVESTALEIEEYVKTQIAVVASQKYEQLMQVKQVSQGDYIENLLLQFQQEDKMMQDTTLFFQTVLELIRSANDAMKVVDNSHEDSMKKFL